MKPILSAVSACGLSLLVLLAAACAAPPPQQQPAAAPKLPPAGADGEYKLNLPELGRGAARYIRLTLGEELSRDCGLVNIHFKFDSSDPLPQEKLELQRLSECLAEPPRKDLKLVLVGRADVRGDAAYNQELGMRRATRVKELLVRAGISGDRISIESRGEQGAVGDDGMYSYGYDRRVDVVVLGVVHAPR